MGKRLAPMKERSHIEANKGAKSPDGIISLLVEVQVIDYTVTTDSHQNDLLSAQVVLAECVTWWQERRG